MVAPKEGTLQALAYFIVPSELPSGNSCYCYCCCFANSIK
uniref:Uncharacterized protein n=1 Tax=Oryza nivara TaxID=4536 RepID=A0A0E0IAA5_ORYNI